MQRFDELGYEKAPRAGLIPYMYDDEGELTYLMMVSSDPKFGGPRPMISKGKIEQGEDTLTAAVREAEEELGLVSDNMIGKPKLLSNERVTLYSGAYDLTVYAVQIRERYRFVAWCDETAFTVWMDLETFRSEGRRDHIKYVETLEREVRRSR